MPPIIFLAIAVALLIISIVRLNLHPFLALLLTGIFLGFAVGMPMEKVIESLLDGFASTLKWIGIVMILGTLIGEILNDTGGSIKISNTILKIVGQKRVPLTMGLTGYVVSIPVFVDVAYIMLQSITELLSVKSKRNILVVGLSLTAGLTATHALMPPTPGPLAAAGLVSANLGRVILINFFVAFCAATGGLIWATLYCKKIDLPYDQYLRDKFEKKQFKLDESYKPGIVGSFAPIFFPLILIAAGSFAKTDTNNIFGKVFQFLGTPTVALLFGVFIASFLLKANDRMKKLQETLDRSIQKAAIVIMITGAGGAFGGVIKASNIGPSVANAISSFGIPGIIFPFLLAAALTTSTGSLTVSMVTSSSIIAPMLDSLNISPEMTVALIGSGSFCVFHTNSSFFWLLSRLHQIPPNTLFRTFTLQSLYMGLCGFLGILLLWIIGVH